MTFSEYSRIMEIEEAKADNVMADIDYMIESANATHKLNLADLDFKFESEDYDMDAMTQMYAEEANDFTAKIKQVWDKFYKWLQGIISAIFNLQPKEDDVKAAEEKNPEGVKVPVDVEKAVKEMDKCSNLMTPAYAKRLMKDVDTLSKKGIKVNLKVDYGKQRVHNTNHTPLIDRFLDACTSLMMVFAIPTATVVTVGTVANGIRKAFDFTKVVQRFSEAIAENTGVDIGGILGSLQSMTTKVSGFATSIGKHIPVVGQRIEDAAKKHEEKNAAKAAEKKAGASAKDVYAKANALLSKTRQLCGAKTDAIKTRLKSSYETAKTALQDISSTVDVEGFNCTSFISDCDEAISKATPKEAAPIITKLEGVLNKIPHDSHAPKEGLFSQVANKLGVGHKEESASSDFDDDTVYSQFFESTDMMPKSDTSYFLKSDDERIDDMLKILDSM